MAKPSPLPKPLVIKGTKGTDNLIGGSLKHIIIGLDSDDRLTGALGSDSFIGGAGADTFEFLSFEESVDRFGIDTIKDFSGENRDRVDLSALGEATLKPYNHTSFSGLQAVFAYALLPNLESLRPVLGDGKPSNPDQPENSHLNSNQRPIAIRKPQCPFKAAGPGFNGANSPITH